jgi:phosphoribosylglycinamide formyltransferase-1
MRKNTAVLISGNGSNLQALIDAAKAADYPAQIALVIANKAEAYGLTRAREAGIPAVVIPHADFESREAFDRAMHAELLAHRIDIVCLAGFMRLLSPWFVGQWQGRLVNIHPSLLPRFKGAHAVRDALAAGAEESGCTVHLVTEELDSGPILGQERVPVLAGDTEAVLHARIHAAEHRLYPAALKALAKDLVNIDWTLGTGL